MKKSSKTRSRSKKKKSRKSRSKSIGEYVKVVDRGPNKCVLCGRRFKRNDVKVMIGSHFMYAHIECVTSYSFSMMD